MVPGASNKVIEMIRVSLLQRRVNAGRAHEVFLVVPASDVEVGHGSVLQIRGYGMLLPEIVVWMLDEVVPSGQLPVEVALVRTGKCAKPQVPGVSVVLIEVEVSVLLLRAFEQGGVLEAIAQAERAVVMEVIIDEHVIGGCLLAGCLQCGMRIKQRLGHQPARIGNYRVARRRCGRPALSELGVKVSLHPAQALRTPL